MCHCDFTTSHFSFHINISSGTPTASPTASPTYFTEVIITPPVGGGHNYKTYWVGHNIYSLTRVNSVQAWRPHDFRIASFIAKNWTEGLLENNKLSFEESKSKINVMNLIGWIWFYMEDNGM